MHVGVYHSEGSPGGAVFLLISCQLNTVVEVRCSTKGTEELLSDRTYPTKVFFLQICLHGFGRSFAMNIKRYRIASTEICLCAITPDQP